MNTILRAALFAALAAVVLSAPLKLSSYGRGSAFEPIVKVNHLHSAHGEPLADLPLAKNGDRLLFSLNAFNSLTGLVGAGHRLKNNFVTKHNALTHMYMKQMVNGLEVANGDASVHVNADGQVLSVSESYFRGSVPTETPKAEITPAEAIQSLAKYLGQSAEDLAATEDENVFTSETFALEPIPTKLAFIQVDAQSNLELVYDIVVLQEEHWFNAFVSAVTGEVHAVHDWVADAETYNVFPLPGIDPLRGEQTVVVNPYSKSSGSPLGWLNQNGKTFTNTIGNNVYAQDNPTGGTGYLNNYRPDGGANHEFLFKADLTKDPKDYKDAAITNLFYWNNMMHDIFYQYGFDEVSGNFQESNFGKGGAENDAVIANAQDGSGYNNANFATPPDGQ
eukprot:Colp12_sorted_trinity150504_noHs@8539